MSDAQLDEAIEGELLRLGASFVAELFVRTGAGRPGVGWDDIEWALLRLRARGAVERYDMRAGPLWRRRTAAVVYQLTERRARELRAGVSAGRDDAAGGAALRLTLREYLDRRDGHLRAWLYAALKAVPCIDDDERGRLAREAVATAAGGWERDLPPSILAWLDTAHVDVPEAGRAGGAPEEG